MEITFTLSDELAERAQASGILNTEKIAALLNDELDPLGNREVSSLEDMLEAMKPVRQAFREAYPDATDDNVWQLIDDIRHDRML